MSNLGAHYCLNCNELVSTKLVNCQSCGNSLNHLHSNSKKFRKMLYQIVAIHRSITIIKSISQSPQSLIGHIILLLLSFVISLHLIIIFNKAGIDFVLSSTTSPSSIFLFIIYLLFLGLLAFFFFIMFEIFWQLVTFGIIVALKILGTSSNLKTVKAIIGYSQGSVLLAWTISLPLRFFTPSTSFRDISYTEIKQAVNSINSNPIGIIITSLIFIGWIWAAILSIIGVTKGVKSAYFSSIIACSMFYGLFIFMFINSSWL